MTPGPRSPVRPLAPGRCNPCWFQQFFYFRRVRAGPGDEAALVDGQPIGRWWTLTLLVNMAKPITQLPQSHDTLIAFRALSGCQIAIEGVADA